MDQTTDVTGPSLGLAAHDYNDPQTFELDKTKIFYRTWHCAGHVSELAEPGCYVTAQIVDEEVFVVRDAEGRLRAFHNVCRHRGHPLLEGRGRCGAAIVCPYHAWRYRLDGRLDRAGAADAKALEDAKIGLKPVRLEVFCGLVFVNLDEKAASLESQIGHVRDSIESFVPEPSALRFVCEARIEHDCNWKISVENYNECYHCPTVHGRSLTRGVLDMEGYTVEPQGPVILHMGKAQTRNEKQYNYDIGQGARGAEYGAWFIWPAMAVNCYPGGYFSLRQWLPQHRRKTVYLYRWFSGDGIADSDVEALMRTHRDTTGAEDAVVVAKVQKGVESRAYEPGPLMIGTGPEALSEVGVAHFHQLYRRALAS